MSKYETFTNAVPKKSARTIQLNTLKEISDIVMNTAGPQGSTTMIVQNGKYPVYTKDGKRTVENIQVFGEIEYGILDQVRQITQTVVDRVGDGTSTATRLAYLIFKALVELEENNEKWSVNPRRLIDIFNRVTSVICDRIKSNARELTDTDIYDICMISTDGDEELSNIIDTVYKSYGKDVYIDIKTSTSGTTFIKEFEGFTFEKGYASPAYINRAKDSTCTLSNPRIYIFKDPIDTPEMIGLFSRIVYENIMNPYSNLMEYSKAKQMMGQMTDDLSKRRLEKMKKNSVMTPTLIMVPHISRDAQSMMETLEKICYSYDKDEDMMTMKPPICIVSGLQSKSDELDDVSLMCGCKQIMKYIDPSIQEQDIKAGKAPTVDTVCQFYGIADRVVIYSDRMTIINPDDMFEKKEGNIVVDEDGNPVYSAVYNSLTSFLNNELKKAETEGDSLVEISRLKRRLNALSTNLVDLYIGGISVTDRDKLKDLADDAVRNCRSAARNGVGRACSFEGFFASFADVSDNVIFSEDEDMIRKIINKAYKTYIEELYATCIPSENAKLELGVSIMDKVPINLRTLEYDNNVLSSIDSDIVVLECIAKIITIMFTTNQVLVPTAFENRYREVSK